MIAPPATLEEFDRWGWTLAQTHAIEQILKDEGLEPLNYWARATLLQSAHRHFILTPELLPNLDAWVIKKRKAWTEVEQLSEKLATSLAALKKVDDTPPFFEATDRQLGRLRDFAVDALFQLNAEPISGVAATLKLLATNGASDPPERAFYRDVMMVWTELGGKLGVSTNANTNEVYGPFIRFFRAVVEPMMGDKCPPPATIKKYVQAEKERRQNSEKPKRRNSIRKGRIRSN